MSVRGTLIVTCVVVSVTLSTEAYTADDPGDSTALQEVIVTAQKRDELASKIPMSLTVLSGASLQGSGVVNVEDLQNVTPSISIGRNAFGVNISIRGVTSTDNSSKGDQGISFNVDGIPIGRAIEQGLAFFDIERVEVLRGPQGTLYGRSSTGGAVNVITNKPRNEFQGSVDAELGDYNTRRGTVMLNVPVTDSLAIRFAGNFNKRDGYLDPVIGNNQTPFRAKSRDDTDDMTGRISALYTFQDVDSLLVTGTFGHVGGVGPSTANVDTLLGNSTGRAQRAVYYNPFGGNFNDQFRNFNTELNLTFGAVHVTYDGAYLRYQADELTSSTNNPLSNYQGPPPAQPVYNWLTYSGPFVTDSHELRFSNAQPGRLEWVLGGNWYRENLHEDYHQWGAPATDPTLAGSFNGINPLNQTIHNSHGFFAQGTYHVTDPMSVTLGARRSSDRVDRVGTFAAGPGPWPDELGNVCVAPANCIGPPNNGVQAANKTTYRVEADYEVAQSQLVYVSVATGYKAGGFNDFDPVTHGTAPYDPEQLTAYELGYKGQPLPNLQFNSSVFYYDYPKDQITSLVNIVGNFVLFTRAVPVEIYGWENELHYRITTADQINASVFFEKSKYKDFTAGINRDVNWSGLSLDKTPSVAATLEYTHEWRLTQGSLTARVAGRYSSSYLVSDFVDAIQVRQKAFTRTDLNLRYRTEDDKYYVEGFVENLEDKIQMTGALGGYIPGAANSLSVAVSEPRLFGVRVGAKF